MLLTTHNVTMWMGLLIEKIMDYIYAYEEDRADPEDVRATVLQAWTFLDFMIEFRICDADALLQLGEWLDQLSEEY